LTLNPRDQLEQHGDLQSVPDAARGYEAWLRDMERGEEWYDLVTWARATLPAPVMPCVCLDRRCLRCRISSLVDTPEPGPEEAEESPPF
jgi:hypothetical protein